MNIYTKIGIMACGVAVVSSAATAFAISKLNNNGSSSLFMAPEATEMRAGGLYTVSNLASTPPTDFTHAAESTINGVVSIKSYATPKGYYGQQGGGNYNYIDPFEFFFGSPRQQTPRQQSPRSGNGAGAEQQRGLGLSLIHI